MAHVLHVILPPTRHLLHEAIRQRKGGKLARLLRDGWSPNTTDSKNRTPRHCAANHGCRTIVSQLIDAGANPNAENDAMKTPLHLATSHGYEETVV